MRHGSGVTLFCSLFPLARSCGGGFGTLSGEPLEHPLVGVSGMTGIGSKRKGSFAAIGLDSRT